MKKYLLLGFLALALNACASLDLGVQNQGEKGIREWNQDAMNEASAR